MAFRINLREVIHSLSDALDLVGIDDVQHGKRVAFMSVECARAMGWDRQRIDQIYHASLLHDCGVSSTQVHRHLVTELDWSGSQDHCLRGEQLLGRCALFDGLPLILRYHHTHWQEMPARLDRQTAMASNLIYLTDRVDALCAQHGCEDILMARHGICEVIAKYRGSFFEAGLVDCFLRAASSEMFWLTLSPRHLDRYLLTMEKHSAPVLSDSKAVLEIAAIFADIVDAKSQFTVEHSSGVARLSRYLASLNGLEGEELDLIEAAGLLHDLGKLNVPDEILEKPGPLTDAERVVMMRHSFESFQILARISGFEQIAQWAAFHHEAMNGTGYPFHKRQEGLSIEARIIAVADVFQALAQNRPYRPSLPQERIMAIMEEMAADGHLDQALVACVKDHLDACWRYATGKDRQ